MGSKDPNWKPPMQLLEGPIPYEWDERYMAKRYKARVTHRVVYELPWGGLRTLTLQEPSGGASADVLDVELLSTDLEFWERFCGGPFRPRGDWRTLLKGMSAALPDAAATGSLDAAIEEAAEKLEAAVIEDPVDPNWVTRLSTVEQAALLVAVLKVLDELGKFVTDTTGAGVPESIRSGTQILFAVVAVLLLLMEQRARSSKDG